MERTEAYHCQTALCTVQNTAGTACSWSWQSVCIRTVQWSVNWNNVLGCFTLSCSRCSVGTQNPHPSPPAPIVTKFRRNADPSNHRTPHLLIPSPAAFCQHSTDRHFPALCFVTRASLPEGWAGTSWEPSVSVRNNNNNNEICDSHGPPPPPPTPQPVSPSALHPANFYSWANWTAWETSELQILKFPSRDDNDEKDDINGHNMYHTTTTEDSDVHISYLLS
jgi:hypothetical protein